MLTYRCNYYPFLDIRIVGLTSSSKEGALQIAKAREKGGLMFNSMVVMAC